MDHFKIDNLPLPPPYQIEVCQQDSGYWRFECKWPPMPEEEEDFIKKAISKGRVFLSFRQNGESWKGLVLANVQNQPYRFTHFNRRWVGSFTCSFWGIQE